MKISPIPDQWQISAFGDLGNCSLLARAGGHSGIEQLIDARSFSVLIGSGQAGYNLSITTGCFNNGSGNITVFNSFYKENFLSIGFQEGKTVLQIETLPNHFHWHS